jgi:hypothetical protein
MRTGLATVPISSWSIRMTGGSRKIGILRAETVAALGIEGGDRLAIAPYDVELRAADSRRTIRAVCFRRSGFSANYDVARVSEREHLAASLIGLPCHERREAAAGAGLRRSCSPATAGSFLETRRTASPEPASFCPKSSSLKSSNPAKHH